MHDGERPATRRRGRRSRGAGPEGSNTSWRDGDGLSGDALSGVGGVEPVDETPADPVEVARTIALGLLDRRDYTRAELAQRLARRGVPEDAAATVLDRFEEVRLLDDQRYAERYAVSRQQSRALSRSAVRRELVTKGIDAELADSAVSAIDDDTERDTALEFARRKARPLAGLERQVQYRRLAGALARKGYSAHLVHDTVATVLAELADDAVELEVPPDLGI